MSSKPINFSEYMAPNDWGAGCLVVRVTPPPTHERAPDAIAVGGYHFKDPAKLRELAAKINEAAQALEESKRLTFADLKLGEFFKVAGDDEIRLKADHTLWRGVTYTSRWGGREIENKAVVRLVATFTEAPEYE